jgi:hypothetical protein
LYSPHTDLSSGTLEAMQWTTAVGIVDTIGVSPTIILSPWVAKYTSRVPPRISGYEPSAKEGTEYEKSLVPPLFSCVMV